ncbi:MAG TPA: CDP-diacylglycerol--glycerol-3-phosphate 3-phosphatidyltransferase [Kiloniellaceae bacterium]|nr:CDP-diacylglycerol--glycerol-3-phosphate 3-phosphatidyltransferase [Kiloniellaceae bacterium]
MLSSLPNILTLSRIVMIPILVALLYVDTPLCRWLALGAYTVACVTDYFDGYLARNMNETSALGRFLDPIADKLLIASVIVMLVGTDQIAGLTIIAGMIILCREILISGLREFLAEIKVSVPVSKLAKWKTTIQMLAMGFLIVGTAGPDGWPVLLIGETGLWIAAVLTLVTGYDYLSKGLEHMLKG